MLEYRCGGNFEWDAPQLPRISNFKANSIWVAVANFVGGAEQEHIFLFLVKSRFVVLRIRDFQVEIRHRGRSNFSA
jgi:hypothetical protein